MAEKTFVIIKPDSMVRGLSGKIITRFENKGLKIVGLKMLKIKRKQLEELYSHLIGRPFLEEYFHYMRKTPVIMVVLEGMNAIDIVRKMCGVTNCRESDPSTIRGQYGMSGRMNVIHAADSVANAEREMNIFFKPKEIHRYKVPLTQVMYSIEEMQTMGIQKKVLLGRPRKLPGKEDE